MAAANATLRAVGAAILGSGLGEFSAHQIEMDCGNPACRKDRRYQIAELAGVHGKELTVARLIRRMRCEECRGKAVSVALLRPIGVRKAGAAPRAAGGAGGKGLRANLYTAKPSSLLAGVQTPDNYHDKNTSQQNQRRPAPA